MRTAFNSIYFIKNFSLKSLFLFLRSISILLIVGLPFIFITVLLAYVRLGTVSGLWDEVSPFRNLKLLIRDGKIIRNMKKTIVEGGKICAEVVNRGGHIHQGLLPLNKGVAHAVSFREGNKVGLGVTYTTKNQKRDDDLLSRNDDSLVYVQGFEDNELIHKREMKNNVLVDLLNNRGAIDAIYANLHVLKMSNAEIVFNDKNRQFLRKLNSDELKESKDFLNKCGGIDKVKKAFEYKEEISEILISARKMLYFLSNANPSSIPEKYMKYKETHNILIELEKANHLDSDSELLRIKHKIDGIINGFL